MKKTFYENEREIALQTKQQLSRRSRRLVWERTAAFSLLVLCTAAAYDGRGYLYWGSFCLLLSFLLLIRTHDRVKGQERLLAGRLSALADSLARFDGRWRTFPEDGSGRRMRSQDIDLHLFGAGSVYQYLCRARTRAGRERLAAALSPVPPKSSLIRKRQRAVAELLEHPRFCLGLEALARLLPAGHDTRALVAGLERETLLQSPFLAHTAWLLPAVTLAAFLLALLGFSGWGTPGMLLLLQFALVLLLSGRHGETLAPLGPMHRELHLYGGLFERIEEASFAAPHLCALRQRLLADTAASHAIGRLALLADAVSLRQNLVFYVLANTLLLWDFHCAAWFLRWQDMAARRLDSWLSVWAEFEVLLSLATVGETREAYAFPEILESPVPHIEGTGLLSPLIPEEKAVPNDALLSPSTTIITGSNMSGKTTWLRTIAVNAVLAYAGAPVCARRLTLSQFAIFTSIRVHDDIGEGLSTFYAELLRIKEMMEYSRRESPMLICIDEIFKGTNSADRIIGAREAIRRLTNAWSIVLVTTHDLELCDLETESFVPVQNCHFEERYENDKICFDFRLKPGRCRTANAQYLLRLAGIMD